MILWEVHNSFNIHLKYLRSSNASPDSHPHSLRLLLAQYLFIYHSRHSSIPKTEINVTKMHINAELITCYYTDQWVLHLIDDKRYSNLEQDPFLIEEL